MVKSWLVLLPWKALLCSPPSAPPILREGDWQRQSGSSVVLESSSLVSNSRPCHLFPSEFATAAPTSWGPTMCQVWSFHVHCFACVCYVCNTWFTHSHTHIHVCVSVCTRVWLLPSAWVSHWTWGQAGSQQVPISLPVSVFHSSAVTGMSMYMVCQPFYMGSGILIFVQQALFPMESCPQRPFIFIYFLMCVCMCMCMWKPDVNLWYCSSECCPFCF